MRESTLSLADIYSYVMKLMESNLCRNSRFTNMKSIDPCCGKVPVSKNLKATTQRPAAEAVEM